MSDCTKTASKVVVIVWALLLTGALAIAQTRGAATKDPAAAFDRGAELIAKDPFAARGHFDAAAAGFERMLDERLSQGDRAVVWYNVGAARQLAGDTGPAVLAFRRAELLAPVTTGLSERLTAARAAARGDATPPLPASSSARETEFDAVGFARDWGLSIPRVWLWRCAIGAWVALWACALVRLVAPGWTLRPAWSVMVACLLAASAPGALLVVHEMRERAAEGEVVVMADVTARLEPDDLTGGPAPAGALRGGMEMVVLERRTGGNGMEWVWVKGRGSEADAPMWVPVSAVATVSEQAKAP